MKKVYMVIGCPGSGKSHVCDQLRDHFHYVHHDAYVGMVGGTYVQEILKEADKATKPLLIEAPFSISQIKDPLEQFGFEITPVFIQEDHQVIADRYQKREGKPIPKGHLTRQNTYLQRANDWKAFKGTSSEVLEHLKREITASSGPWGAVETAIKPETVTVDTVSADQPTITSAGGGSQS